MIRSRSPRSTCTTYSKRSRSDVPMTTKRPHSRHVIKVDRVRIRKNSRGFGKRHAVFREMRRSLDRVPFKVALDNRWHRIHQYGLYPMAGQLAWSIVRASNSYSATLALVVPVRLAPQNEPKDPVGSPAFGPGRSTNPGNRLRRWPAAAAPCSGSRAVARGATGIRDSERVDRRQREGENYQ
jgi:hypothetical protein